MITNEDHKIVVIGSKVHSANSENRYIPKILNNYQIRQYFSSLDTLTKASFHPLPRLSWRMSLRVSALLYFDFFVDWCHFPRFWILGFTRTSISTNSGKLLNSLFLDLIVHRFSKLMYTFKSFYLNICWHFRICTTRVIPNHRIFWFTRI